jgi:hypothetical protein
MVYAGFRNLLELENYFFYAFMAAGIEYQNIPPLNSAPSANYLPFFP